MSPKSCVGTATMERHCLLEAEQQRNGTTERQRLGEDRKVRHCPTPTPAPRGWHSAAGGRTGHPDPGGPEGVACVAAAEQPGVAWAARKGGVPEKNAQHCFNERRCFTEDNTAPFQTRDSSLHCPGGLTGHEARRLDLDREDVAAVGDLRSHRAHRAIAARAPGLHTSPTGRVICCAALFKAVGRQRGGSGQAVRWQWAGSEVAVGRQ